MRKKNPAKQKNRTLLFLLLFGACIVCVIIGFAVVASPITVTFDSAGGEYVKTIKSSPAKAVSLPTPIRPGYKFEGWATSATSEKVVTKITKKNTSLVAKWTRQDVVASFYVAGNYIGEIAIPENQQNGLPTDFALSPTTDDCFGTFAGWYYYNEKNERIELKYNGGTWSLEKNGVYVGGINANNPFSPSTSNVALNALVQYRRVNIDYVGADATTTVSSLTNVLLNTNLTLNSSYLPGEGKTLVGWKLKNDDSDIFMPGSSFFLDPNYYDLCTGKGTSPKLTLYAVVHETSSNEAYLKSLDDNGNVKLTKTTAAAGQSRLVNIVDGTNITATFAAFDFAGGYGSKLKDTSTYAAASGYPSVATAAMTKTVQATVDTDNLTYQDSRARYIRLPLADGYAVAGMRFAGWKCSLDGKVYSAGLAYQIPRGTKAEDNLSFTAVWEDVKALVKFDLNGGESTWKTTAYSNKKYGDKISLPTPTRYGYVFAGWVGTAANTANATTYTPGTQSFTNFELTNQLSILTAKWTPKTIDKLELVQHDGTFVNMSQTNIAVGSVVYLPRIPDADVHNGWKIRNYNYSANIYDEYAFGAPFVTSIKIEVTSDFCKRHHNIVEGELFDRDTSTIVIQGY